METIKYKMKRIKRKAETVRDNTEEKETELWMAEIVEVCIEALVLIDEVAAAANKVKCSIR
jgi:hypothetical protein